MSWVLIYILVGIMIFFYADPSRKKDSIDFIWCIFLWPVIITLLILFYLFLPK